jgi:hypothetical protein
VRGTVAVQMIGRAIYHPPSDKRRNPILSMSGAASSTAMSLGGSVHRGAGVAPGPRPRVRPAVRSEVPGKRSGGAGRYRRFGSSGVSTQVRLPPLVPEASHLRPDLSLTAADRRLQLLVEVKVGADFAQTDRHPAAPAARPDRRPRPAHRPADRRPGARHRARPRWTAHRRAQESEGRRGDRAPRPHPRRSQLRPGRRPGRAARAHPEPRRGPAAGAAGDQAPGVRRLRPAGHLRQDRRIEISATITQAIAETLHNAEDLPGGGLERRSKGHSGGPIRPSERRTDPPAILAGGVAADH